MSTHKICFHGEIRKLFCDYYLFVLRVYDPVNPLGSVMPSMVSLPNHTFTGQANSPITCLSGYHVFCTFLCLKLTTALLESEERRE